MQRLSNIVLLALCLSGGLIQSVSAAKRSTKCTSTVKTTTTIKAQTHIGSSEHAVSSQKAYSTGTAVLGSVLSSGAAASRSVLSSGAAASRSVLSSGAAASGSVLSPSLTVSDTASTRRASLGTAISSRQTLSKIASSVTTDSNGCLPISTTTTTLFTTSYSYMELIDSASVLTNTVFAGFATVYTATDITSIEFITTATVTVIETSTSTSTSVLPSSTIITVPTAAGFTPILCLPAWRLPRTTSTLTYFVTYTNPVQTFVTADTYTLTYPTPTSTITSVVSWEVTSYSTVIVPTVITRNPTSTFYAACASNNVVSKSPSGSDLGRPYNAPGVEFVLVPALDPVDCCNACQANTTCLVSTGYYLGGGSQYICYFSAQSSNSNTCDPTFVAANVTASDQFLVAPEYISNSGCGQFS